MTRQLYPGRQVLYIFHPRMQFTLETPVPPLDIMEYIVITVRI
jgi:hypothetical protein